MALILSSPLLLHLSLTLRTFRVFLCSSPFQSLIFLSLFIRNIEYISLRRTGLPRIIPALHRKVIRTRSERADKVVQLYLSWFTLAKIIKTAKPVKKATFESITEPGFCEESFRKMQGFIKEFFPKMKPKYLSFVSRIPLNKGFRWVPTWKAIPNDDRMFGCAEAVPSIFTSLTYEIASFARDIRFLHSRQDGFFSPGILFNHSVLWPFDYSGSTRTANMDLSFYERAPYGIGHVFDNLANALEGTYLRPGRLSQVIEGGGKRRIFAIGNYIKQRLLFPVHEWAMKVLSELPMDGTFYQERPIKRLAAMTKNRKNSHKMQIFSFDLKSATDRFPLSFIYEVFSCFFGPTMASCVVNGTLGLNSFEINSLLFTKKGTKRAPI